MENQEKEVVRPLHELYELLLDHFDEDGICDSITSIWFNDIISFDEKTILKSHFISQKPTKRLHTEFFIHDTFTGKGWWWGVSGLSTDQRKLFIQKMIEITKPKQQ